LQRVDVGVNVGQQERLHDLFSSQSLDAMLPDIYGA
jgi:hypothetical protein